VGGDCGGVCQSGARARQLIKRWAATAPQGIGHSPSMPAQKLRSRRVGQRPPVLMPLRVSSSRPVQAPTRQQRKVTSGSLPCGPMAYAGGHSRRPPASTPM
jgi:hypothetical protein